MSKVLAGLTAGLLVAATVAAGPVTHLVWQRNHPAVATLADGPTAAATAEGSLPAAPPAGGTGGASAGAGTGSTGTRPSGDGTATDPATTGDGAGTPGSTDGTTTGSTTGSTGEVPHRRTLPSTPHPGTTPKTPAAPGGSPASGTVVRSVKLTLPAAAQVGSNVLGYIHVADSNGQVVSPIPGALVTLQQQRAGSWQDLSEYLTDDNGLVALSFTSRTTLTLRAALVEGGRAVLSPVTVMAAHDLVTWAARPAMTVGHGASTTYSFRVRPATGQAHLQYARASDPTHWYAAPTVDVGPTGVVSQAITLPSAGLWLVRGATVASDDNASGYTSTLTVRAR